MRQYLALLKDISENGESHDDRTGVGTHSDFVRQLRFDLRDGFPLMTTKRIPFRWVAEELFWILSGDTNESHLREKGVDIWQEWADEKHTRRFLREPGDLGPVYGYLWRSYNGKYPRLNGIDQIENLIKQIERTPNSRRLIVTAWDPRSSHTVDLPPCHTLFQFKVHGDKTLSCHLYMRSADLFLGVPFNIASYALLTHMVAHVTGLGVRNLGVSFGDVHVYKNHFEAVKEQLARTPKALPKLTIVDPENKFKSLNGLTSISYQDLLLTDYHPDASIKAPVAI